MRQCRDSVLIDGGQSGDHEPAAESRIGGHVHGGNFDRQVIAPSRKLFPLGFQLLARRTPWCITTHMTDQVGKPDEEIEQKTGNECDDRALS